MSTCDNCAYYANGANDEACDGCFTNKHEHPNFKPKVQPCEDCISRQAVRDFIKRLQRWCVMSEDGKFNNVGLLYDDVEFGIDKLPSVTPKKKTGWYIAHGMYEDRFRCSCGFTKVMDTNMIEWKQCPVCGGTRIMESEDEEVNE